MKELIDILRAIGIPDDDLQRIEKHYYHDMAGLQRYVLIMRAMQDDRHEYLD